MGLSDLPRGSGADHVRCLKTFGWTLLDRRGRGAHFLLKKPGNRYVLSIPDHREVKPTLLAKQLNLAEIDHVEYKDRF